MFVDALARVKAAEPFELFAWVLMPEHAHLLIRPRIGGAPVATILTDAAESLGFQVSDLALAPHPRFSGARAY